MRDGGRGPPATVLTTPVCRFLPTTPAFYVPVRGVPVRALLYTVWHKKTRVVWLSDSEKILMICLFVLAESTNLTDTQTDGQTDSAWRHRPRLHSIARQKRFQLSSDLAETQMTVDVGGLFQSHGPETIVKTTCRPDEFWTTVWRIVMVPDERRRRQASGADLHASERYDGVQPCSCKNGWTHTKSVPVYDLYNIDDNNNRKIYRMLLTDSNGVRKCEDE